MECLARQRLSCSQRDDFTEEMAAALVALADHIETIVGANVVPMAQAG